MSNDFWAKKLGASTPQRTPVQNSVPESRAPWWRSVTPQPEPEQQQEQVQAPGNDEMKKTQQVYERQQRSQHCPECGSGNYSAPQGSTRHRCFDCGYPIVQSTSGMSNTASEGPSHPARQVSTANNYNPQTVVEHIG